jgi:hypothetical protein
VTDHPITPPPELVEQWFDDTDGILDEFAQAFAAKAARWGADQELEACCEWAAEQDRDFDLELRAARRPKPPSAVAQAEALIERHEDGWCPSPHQWHVIREGLAEGRRALEQLDD